MILLNIFNEKSHEITKNEQNEKNVWMADRLRFLG